MMKRLFALVVAVAVVSAPVALEVCQLTCESKAMQPSMPHGAQDHVAHHHTPADHAACHEHGGTTHQLSPVNGFCDHSTESTPSLVAARNTDTGVSLLATVPSIGSFGLVVMADRISVRESAWSRPLATPLAVPLRV
jgi:Ni/Co efflux regulator RcnB